MARLGLGILVIAQKPSEEHAKELKDYADVFGQKQGVAPPRP